MFLAEFSPNSLIGMAKSVAESSHTWFSKILAIKLYFDDEGLVRSDIQRFNPAVPTLRGTVIIASYVYSVVNDTSLEVRRLYGDDGIAAILEDPTWVSAPEHLQCDETYLLRKAREVQPKRSSFGT